MTNTLAIWLVVLVVGFLALDHFVLGLDMGLFIARKFTELLTFVAFWR